MGRRQALMLISIGIVALSALTIGLTGSGTSRILGWLVFALECIVIILIIIFPSQGRKARPRL